MATAGEKVTCLVGVFGGVGVLSASVSTIAFFHGLRVGVGVGVPPGCGASPVVVSTRVAVLPVVVPTRVTVLPVVVSTRVAVLVCIALKFKCFSAVVYALRVGSWFWGCGLSVSWGFVFLRLAMLSHPSLKILIKTLLV